MNPSLKALGSYPMTRLADARARVEGRGARIYDFGVGDPREPTDPRIREALVRGIPAVSQYPATNGGAPLREAIGAYVTRTFGVSLDTEREIVATNGSKEAIFHFAMAVVDPGSERRAVLYGEPGYPVYEAGALLCGAEPIALPLRADRGWLLEPEDIDPAIAGRASVLWINVPHNPTGAVAPFAYLERCARFALDRGIVLACDECYVDLAGDRRGPSILEVAREGVVAFHSLSKRSGMTGYRSGFLAGDAKLVGAVRALRPYVGVGTPDFVQAAASVAWADDGHVAERRRTFEAKRKILGSALSQAGCRIEASKGALYLWFAPPGERSSEAFALELLDRTGVLVVPGVYFGPSGEGRCRLALVPTLEECEAAASAICRGIA